MSRHMTKRTTVRLPAELLKKAQRKAGKPMTQKSTGMPTQTKDLGQETGTAKDSAGTSQMREESKKEPQKR